MKLKIIALLAIFLVPAATFGQKKVTEKDVIGTWKLIIEIDDDDEEDEDVDENYDRDVDGGFLGHVISSSVLALVSNLLDEIDIRFEFYKDGTLEVYAMGEKEDNDDNRWRINKSGELVIADESDRDWDDDDDIWMLKDGNLQAYERRGSRLKEKEVHLVKVTKGK